MMASWSYQPIALLAAVCVAIALGPNEARGSKIIIDGNVGDWAQIEILPIQDAGRAEYSVGSIRSVKVTQDEEFLFAQIHFSRARPFENPAEQGGLRPGVWDDFTYLEIDVDADGEWDYRTKMVAGKRAGQNNLAVLARAGKGSGGKIFLHPEGHKDYVPRGPKAMFTRKAGRLEMRVPRLTLGLESGVVYLRMLVRYRDDAEQKGKWQTRYFPTGGNWFGMQLTPIDIDNFIVAKLGSASAKYEPVITRTEFERTLSPAFMSRDTQHVYPFGRRIVANPRLGSSGPAGAELFRPEVPDARPPKSVKPVFVLSPEGGVRTDAGGGTGLAADSDSEGSPLEVPASSPE